MLELHGPPGFVTIINDNWRDGNCFGGFIDPGFAPPNVLESAICATLNPGAYTAIVRGKNNTSGVALVEVYDLNQGIASKLANISTRAFVGTGDNIVIAGFILGGNSGDDRIVVRGIGPSLTALGCLMRWPIQRWSCATVMERSWSRITTGRIIQLKRRNSLLRVWRRQTHWSLP